MLAAKVMYIRFAISKRDEHTGCGGGIFQAAIKMRKDPSTPPHIVERLHNLRGYFNSNLDAPEEINARAIFWFKADAQETLGRVWELVELLRLGGCAVREITCKRPGKILYEDPHQVAAIPFRDLRPDL